MSLRNYIALHFPLLGVYKRKVAALYDTLTPIKSYSQHGEDIIIHEHSSKNGHLDGIYIDVGSNHPTTISNTYYFYRLGFSGICIEPNSELADLHRKFRSRDQVLKIGLNDKPGLLNLKISKTPVLSSFLDIDPKNLWRTEYIPILTLDDIFYEFNPERVFLLSIDTEGFNHRVISGANKILDITDLVCIEFDDGQDETDITEFLTKKSFRIIKKIGCNLIFQNMQRKVITNFVNN